ncbi:putative LIP-domain-containing protein [Seiridium cardinale]|uniref:LIP-domain-containing protein n=1 Tax=Seiridium cardinale TaxID=138064 RepID=A0ABR2XIF0_9PEZI
MWPRWPLPPIQDPFYTAPPDFESFAPGTVLRIRTDASNIATVVNRSAAYNILYRTVDARYQPSWAVTTLLISHLRLTMNGSSPRLLTHQTQYNSPDVDSSPSYLLSTLYATAADPTPVDCVAEALSRGWYVSVPDFEGPLAALFAGPQAGYAVLGLCKMRNVGLLGWFTGMLLRC